MTIVQVSTPGPQGAPGPAGAAGSPGAPGTPGANGTNGTNGNTILPTTGAPSASAGADGDFANDVTNQVMYGPKAAGAWPAGVSYKGVDGEPGQPGTPGIGAKWQSGTLHTGVVATRGKVMTSLYTNNAQHMARSIHVARSNITQLGVAVANWYVNAGDTNTGAPATVKLSIEYPLGGAVYPLTFGGAASIAIPDFATAFTDLLTLAIPSGGVFAVREYRVCAAGGGIICSGGSSGVTTDVTNGEGYVFGTTVTDLTGTPGAFTSTGGGYLYRPLCVFGPTTEPTYALVGDSRVEGLQDAWNGAWDVGEFARSVGPTRGYMNLGKSGETIAEVTTSNGFMQRALLVNAFATHVLANHGINDITSSVGASTILANQQSLRARFPAKYWYQTTLDTETTSTDNWATTANQTVPSDMTGVRVYVNNYLRSAAAAQGSGYDGIFDTTTVTEDGVNTGLWVPNITADGIHCNATGYGLIASSGVIQVA